jgi:hypothetical protein
MAGLVLAIHVPCRGGKDVDARPKAGMTARGVIAAKTAEKSLHFLVISSLWG